MKGTGMNGILFITVSVPWHYNFVAGDAQAINGIYAAKRRRHMKHVVPARFIFCRGPFGFAVLLFLLIAQPVRSEIIPSDRRIDWNPGVPGGIPQRTTIYVTLQPGATAAQINSALASCPSNQVVFLAAGTYNISGVITVPSYTTLRGAGPGQTVLNLNSGSTGIQFGSGSSPNPNTSTAIT